MAECAGHVALLLYAITYDNDLVKKLAVLRHGDIDLVAALDLLYDGVVADIAELELTIGGDIRERILAVNVGGDTILGADKHYCTADDRLACGVGDGTMHCERLCHGCHRDNQHHQGCKEEPGRLEPPFSRTHKVVHDNFGIK